LSNAIKFSPTQGRVQLNATVSDLQVCISIRDQGPGIAEDFKPRIFQKFSQAESGNARAKGGTGLGLAITKELVEAMAGDIYFESTPGDGATFYLRFNKNEPTTD
jgi:signal transduction histidine kinase